ncbi:hypothetical protein L1987_06997 [Smallanthus sonchifolius]|uniref:Uncharacterized protein n=1 Tax=Smallanthus sonchifolius TaxID=185202 RepID=A0ACB9JZS7_9ASTR|nr:hypothetical protein L1987_06997 [Smallanthus sonchifolius]
MTDAPSRKDVSLGTGDSPNPIGKKVPSKPTKSLKRKRSDTSNSSSQDEDIPPTPTSKGDDLTEAPFDATKNGENNIVKWFFDQKHKSIFIQREYGRIENLKAYDSQSTSSPRIFSALDKKCLLQNDLENAAEIPKAQKIQSRIRSIFKETLKRKIEDLDKPDNMHKAAESNPTKPIFTSVAVESSSIAAEDTLKDKAKGKMPIIEEEEIEKDIPSTTTYDPQSIIPGTNMPLVELSTPTPQQTPSPRKDLSIPSPQRTTTTPSSSRKKRIVIKKRKASITSWNQVGKRYVIKRDDNTREIFKCISDVMELSNSDLERIVSLGIDRFNDSGSARLLLQALKKRGFNVREEEKKEEEPLETIPIVSWELLRMTGQFLIIYQNGVQEYLSADRIVTLHRQLDSLSSAESSQEEDEGKKEKSFGNEDDPDSSDNDEFAVDTEVPLAESQVPISEWYYDLELKKFVIKRLDFTYSVFSNLVDLSVLSPAELKLPSLMPISTTTKEITKL